jgi:hypothetical protein
MTISASFACAMFPPAMLHLITFPTVQNPAFVRRNLFDTIWIGRFEMGVNQL